MWLKISEPDSCASMCVTRCSTRPAPPTASTSIECFQKVSWLRFDQHKQKTGWRKTTWCSLIVGVLFFLQLPRRLSLRGSRRRSWPASLFPTLRATLEAPHLDQRPSLARYRRLTALLSYKPTSQHKKESILRPTSDLLNPPHTTKRLFEKSWSINKFRCETYSVVALQFGQTQSFSPV